MSARLVARTTRLDQDVDLLEHAGDEGVLFEQEGAGLAGHGVALRIELPAGERKGGGSVVTGHLAAIERDDEVGLPGCGPVAFGALPFDDGEPASLVVPRVVVGRSPDGSRWRTEITPDSGSSETAASGPPAVSAPAGQPPGFHVRPGRHPEEWCAAVAIARDAIRGGRARKVVLARDVVVTADVPWRPASVAADLRRAHASSMTFSVDGLVGASPELLVSRQGDVVRSQPMAGTAARTGDPATDAAAAARLLGSAKEREEHQITIDMVHDVLLPWCSYLDALAEPAVVPAGPVQHLATLVEGRLSSPAPSALELATALHPTPAVCGWPREEALGLIAELERIDRGRYAGPVGWVDADGNGRWAVALRCAELDGNRARLLAGNGMVADSDPDAELAETRAKFQAMLSALIRP